MPIAKVFMSGNSQAVRLPKEFRVAGAELIIKRSGDTLILMPQRYRAQALAAALGELDPKFAIERAQPPKQQQRDFS